MSVTYEEARDRVRARLPSGFMASVVAYGVLVTTPDDTWTLCDIRSVAFYGKPEETVSEALLFALAFSRHVDRARRQAAAAIHKAAKSAQRRRGR